MEVVSSVFLMTGASIGVVGIFLEALLEYCSAGTLTQLKVQLNVFLGQSVAAEIYFLSHLPAK